MAFTDIQFHPLHENSKKDKTIIGFVSFKWRTEIGSIGFNSLAVVDGGGGLCVRFPRRDAPNAKDKFDYYYFTDEFKEVATKVAIEAYEEWKTRS